MWRCHNIYVKFTHRSLTLYLLRFDSISLSLPLFFSHPKFSKRNNQCMEFILCGREFWWSKNCIGKWNVHFNYSPYSLTYPCHQSVGRTFWAIRRVLVQFWYILLDLFVPIPLAYDCIRLMWQRRCPKTEIKLKILISFA